MNNGEKTMKNIFANLPTGAKTVAINVACIVVLLTGCGRTVGTDPVTTPAPTTSIETAIDDPVVDDNVVDSGEVTDKPGTTVADTPVIENPTFVQTGDNEYTIYVDCPDNSNAPELSFISDNDTVHALEGAAVYGPSFNLINAVMTHGMQVDPTNPAQINYDAYMDKPFEYNMPILGTYTCVLTNNPSNYGENVETYTMSQIVCDDPTLIPLDAYDLCAILLDDAIVNTNGNLSCALARYNMGPEAWNQAMEECMGATGLTAEEIYANGDGPFVLSYATPSLGDPNYANQVFAYINDSITVTEITESGRKGEITTYIVDRAKT